MVATSASSSNLASLPPPLGAIAPAAWAPGRADAWWWLYLPIVLLAVVLGVSFGWPDFYASYILPEGYGFLELGHFLIPFVTFVLSFLLLRIGLVRRSWPLWSFLLVYGLGNLYIAGEEHSWGQHFFNWSTPEYWTSINRQAETNLHNVSHWFNHRPRLVIEIGILIGGIIIPLIQTRGGPFRQPLLALVTPPLQLTAVAMVALAVKGIDQLQKADLWDSAILNRPSEMLETFIYLFLLYYVIVVGRRIRSLDSAGVPHVPRA